MKRLDTKLAKIRGGRYAKGDFIIADAKDVDMASPIIGCGSTPQHSSGTPAPQRRTRAQFLDQIADVIRQDLIDIMLVSASNLELLTERGVFEGSAVQPAFRGNDTTDIWLPRGSRYVTQAPSRPFRTVSLERMHEAGLGALALYSVTFVNDVEADLRTLEAFAAFRDAAGASDVRYFLEVFNPNVASGVDPSLIGPFVNDCLTRALSGVLRRDRPQFIKYAYNGAAALEELAGWDPQLVVGVLGGGSGTARDAFELIHQAERHGARVALFGRKIQQAEDPLAMIRGLRAVADGDLSPREAVRAYHGELQSAGLVPVRPLEQDLDITENVLRAAASA